MSIWNRVPETYELIPSAYTYGGEAIARLPDGRAVFVPFAIPGERLRVELVEEKKGYARARLLEILEPSPMRIKPPCTHFGECGGCHYQHVLYESQVQAKQSILVEQLERIGGLPSPTVRAAYPSPSEYNYRNHVQFHLAPNGSLGYHKARSDEILPIRECHLPEPPINSVWPQLELEPGTSVERLGLRLGAGDDLQIILESSSFEPPELSVEDLPVSVVHLSPAGELVLAGSPGVEMEIFGRRFRVSAGSFFQANTSIAARMAAHVIELLEERRLLHPGSTILEVYCGVGLFSALLAGKVVRLAGVESSPAAVDDFTFNLDEFDNVEIYEGTAEIVLPALELRPDVILVDPPRQGLSRGALEALLRKSASHVVYVSCDPVTLARDARRLADGGYHLADLAFFDQFPQTYHIESISLWEKGL